MQFDVKVSYLSSDNAGSFQILIARGEEKIFFHVPQVRCLSMLLNSGVSGIPVPLPEQIEEWLKCFLNGTGDEGQVAADKCAEVTCSN